MQSNAMEGRHCTGSPQLTNASLYLSLPTKMSLNPWPKTWASSQTQTPKAVLPLLPAGSDWRGPRSRGCGTVGSTLLTITHQVPTGSTDTAPSSSPWTMFVNSIGACTEWTLEQTACGTVDNDNHGNNHPLHWSRSSWSSHLSQEALHSVVCQSGTNLRLSHGPALVSCQSLRIPSLASMQHNSK